jgi:poly(3-hydroxybutyrate) depolymerase
MYRRLTLIVCAILFYSIAFAQNISSVTMRTKAENNRNASVWYRVPENYREISGRKWRVLVIFGGRNCGGSNEVSNALGWAKWADRNGVFLVAPGFRDDRYWEPQAWSGRALLSALEQIGRSYKINTKNLLYYGYSAGSQAEMCFSRGMDADIILIGMPLIWHLRGWRLFQERLHRSRRGARMIHKGRFLFLG